MSTQIHIHIEEDSAEIAHSELYRLSKAVLGGAHGAPGAAVSGVSGSTSDLAELKAKQESEAKRKAEVEQELEAKRKAEAEQEPEAEEKPKRTRRTKKAAAKKKPEANEAPAEGGQYEMWPTPDPDANEGREPVMDYEALAAIGQELMDAIGPLGARKVLIDATGKAKLRELDPAQYADTAEAMREAIREAQDE